MYPAIFLARRNLRARRGRTLLTLLGIVLGVAVVLAIQITNQTTLDSLRRVFDRTTGQASLLVVPYKQDGSAIDQDLLPRLGAAESVQVAAPSLVARSLLASQAQAWEIALSLSGLASGNLLQVYGIDPELEPQVRVYEIIQGRMPESGKFETRFSTRPTAALAGLKPNPRRLRPRPTCGGG